jgi:hypothetical protein
MAALAADLVIRTHGRARISPTAACHVDEVRVFYDVQENTVQVLAIVSKAEADAWLKAQGTPSKTGGTREGEG